VICTYRIVSEFGIKKKLSTWLELEDFLMSRITTVGVLWDASRFKWSTSRQHHWNSPLPFVH